jgi:hypothetical protein
MTRAGRRPPRCPHESVEPRRPRSSPPTRLGRSTARRRVDGRAPERFALRPEPLPLGLQRALLAQQARPLPLDDLLSFGQCDVGPPPPRRRSPGGQPLLGLGQALLGGRHGALRPESARPDRRRAHRAPPPAATSAAPGPGRRRRRARAPPPAPSRSGRRGLAFAAAAPRPRPTRARACCAPAASGVTRAPATEVTRKRRRSMPGSCTVTPTSASPPPPSPASTSCPSRGTSSSRRRGVPGPARACPCGGRACRGRGGSGR